MKPISEMELLSRLAGSRGLDDFGEILGDFLRGHGFDDAARVVADRLDDAAYELVRDCFYGEPLPRAPAATNTTASAASTEKAAP